MKYWPVIVTRDITEWDGKLYVVGTCPGLVMQHAHMWYMNITRLWLAVEPRIWHDMEPRNVTGDYLAAVRALTPISAASQHPPGAPLGAPPGPEPGPPPGAPPAADGGHQHQPPPPPPPPPLHSRATLAELPAGTTPATPASAAMRWLDSNDYNYY